jgi:polysaccharide biosynthesis/export protein
MLDPRNRIAVRACRFVLRAAGFGLVILAAVTCISIPASSQTQSAGPMKQPEARTEAAKDEYRIGPDDVLSISIADAPEFSGKFRVSDLGLIEIAGLPSSIHAEGQTATELGHVIRQALIDAKQLRDPKVNVFIEEYRGRTITVLGSVARPAVYPLQKRTTVLEAVSMAGGALQNAGATVTVVRGAASAEATNTPVGSVQIIDMTRLQKGEDLSANAEVQNGDIISVSASQVVYVVGAVTKPGGFTLTDPGSGMSVVQAVALAQGFTSVAATHHGLIIRQSTSDTARQLVPVDIAQLVTGKATDVRLAPNDILYIPESGTKKTLKVMGEVAMAAANGAAIYGVGYRVGGIN